MVLGCAKGHLARLRVTSRASVGSPSVWRFGGRSEVSLRDGLNVAIVEEDRVDALATEPTDVRADRTEVDRLNDSRTCAVPDVGGGTGDANWLTFGEEASP